jgi:hypothetical protein
MNREEFQELVRMANSLTMSFNNLATILFNTNMSISRLHDAIVKIAPVAEEWYDEDTNVK